MALSCFPHLSKHVELGDGTGYAYVYHAASASKPTFLLLHGFPSSSYDWRHQIHALAAKGFGVLVPDLLGYGDTDSPADFEAYSLKRMSHHLAEIVANEGIGKVIGVGHDWGSGLLARFYTWHAECLLALIFISVGYFHPSDVAFDPDALNEVTKKHLGYSTFGYQKFFDTEEAAMILDNHPESTTSLLYPTDPEVWKEHLGPVGAAEAWISSNKISSRPAWLTAEEVTTHNRVMSKKGYRGPLNWYKSAMRGIDIADNALLPEERKHVDLPTLLVVSGKDYFAQADMHKKETATWVKQLRIEELSCGHWVQLELPDQLNQLLEGFAHEIEGNADFQS